MNNKVLIIVPLYNELQNIEIIFNSLVKELKKITNNYLISFIDDGSTDETNKYLAKKFKNNKSVNYFSFTKNNGKDIAILAGILENDMFDYTIVIDADGQHPTSKIPTILKKIENFDILIGIRKGNNNIIKNIFSFIFYKFINLFTKENFKMHCTDFSIISKKISKIIKSNPKQFFSYRFYLETLSDNKSYFIFDVKKRFSGKSKFNFFNLLKIALYSFISYTIFPLIVFFIGFFFTTFILFDLLFFNVLDIKALIFVQLINSTIILFVLSILFIKLRNDSREKSFLYFLK